MSFAEVKIDPETLEMTVPNDFTFRVVQYIPQLEIGTVMELRSQSLQSAEIEFYVRRRRASMKMGILDFSKYWLQGKLKCDDARYSRFSQITGAVEAEKLIDGRIKQREMIVAKRREEEQIKKRIMNAQTAVQKAWNSLNKDRKTLKEFIEYRDVMPRVIPDGEVVNHCWDCKGDILDTDYRCKTCNWRICSNCGSCCMNGNHSGLNEDIEMHETQYPYPIDLHQLLIRHKSLEKLGSK